MADELNNKLYTSKLKIGEKVYFLKDLEAQTFINEYKTIVDTLIANKETLGSISNKIYNEAKDAKYATRAKQLKDLTLSDGTYYLAASEDGPAEAFDYSEGNWTKDGEAVQPSDTLFVFDNEGSLQTIDVTIADAIANAITTLSVNSQSPVNGNITITGANIPSGNNDNRTVAESLTALNNAITSAVTGRFRVVEQLPDPAENLRNIIFLVPMPSDEGQTNNTYVEYVIVEDHTYDGIDNDGDSHIDAEDADGEYSLKWEKLGDVKLSLEGYATSDYVDGKILTVNNSIDGLGSRLDTAESNIDSLESSLSGLTAKNIPMDADGDSIYNTIQGILNTTSSISGSAQAITSVIVDPNTGTWTPDPNDEEQLNWVPVSLTTTTGTFASVTPPVENNSSVENGTYNAGTNGSVMNGKLYMNVI